MTNKWNNILILNGCIFCGIIYDGYHAIIPDLNVLCTQSACPEKSVLAWKYKVVGWFANDL